MEINNDVKILSSKRLTRAFYKVEDCNTWESMTFEKERAIEILVAAIKKMTPNSNPLTITITVQGE